MFNSLDDCQNSVDNLKIGEFLSKLKNDYPSDKEKERTKENIKLFNVKNGEELTQTYLRSDVLLLTCVFEKIIKESITQFDINPLDSVSLPGYTWECGLKYTRINLQTLQDKDLFLILEKTIRGGISSVVGNRYVKSDENEKMKYMDAFSLYRHSRIQPLPYGENEMWHGHSDLYTSKLEELLYTPDDSQIGNFVEADLKKPDNIKEKTKNFPFCPENKDMNKDKYNDYMKNIKPKNYAKAK